MKFVPPSRRWRIARADRPSVGEEGESAERKHGTSAAGKCGYSAEAHPERAYGRAEAGRGGAMAAQTGMELHVPHRYGEIFRPEKSCDSGFTTTDMTRSTNRSACEFFGGYDIYHALRLTFMTARHRL